MYDDEPDDIIIERDILGAEACPFCKARPALFKSRILVLSAGCRNPSCEFQPCVGQCPEDNRGESIKSWNKYAREMTPEKVRAAIKKSRNWDMQKALYRLGKIFQNLDSN